MAIKKSPLIYKTPQAIEGIRPGPVPFRYRPPFSEGGDVDQTLDILSPRDPWELFEPSMEAPERLEFDNEYGPFGNNNNLVNQSPLKTLRNMEYSGLTLGLDDSLLNWLGRGLKIWNEIEKDQGNRVLAGLRRDQADYVNFIADRQKEFIELQAMFQMEEYGEKAGVQIGEVTVEAAARGIRSDSSSIRARKYSMMRAADRGLQRINLEAYSRAFGVEAKAFEKTNKLMFEADMIEIESRMNMVNNITNILASGFYVKRAFKEKEIEEQDKELKKHGMDIEKEIEEEFVDLLTEEEQQTLDLIEEELED